MLELGAGSISTGRGGVSSVIGKDGGRYALKSVFGCFCTVQLDKKIQKRVSVAIVFILHIYEVFVFLIEVMQF